MVSGPFAIAATASVFEGPVAIITIAPTEIPVALKIQVTSTSSLDRLLSAAQWT